MVIITPQPLKKFMAAHPDSASSIKQWMATVKPANWGTPNELKAVYPNASLVTNDRVVFNIGGNKYRLVVRIVYPVRTIFIRFIGTHSAYDLIDVATVQLSSVMLALQTITTVSPIRTDAELAQAHHRLDELLAADAYNSADEHLRDEFEVLTALVFYYEQRTETPQDWSLAGTDVIGLLEEALFQQQLSVAVAAQLLQVSEGELTQVMTRQLPISFTLAKRLHQRLDIPAEALLTLPE